MYKMESLVTSIDYEGTKVDTYIILLSSPILLTLYWYHGSPDNLGRYFPGLQKDPLYDYYKYLWQFGAFFLLTFIPPVVFIKCRVKRRLGDFGFGLGDWKYGLKLTFVIIFVVILPVAFMASQMPDVREEYPLCKLIYSRQDLIFWYEVAYVLLYYTAWEFYFRGFLLFGLRDEFGSTNAILIQTISSCLIHLGKPEGEIIGAILVGIIFGIIAIRTKSIWYVFAIHASIGVLTDIFIIFS
jgi:membrane protease YdiL (CAAX protease family)